MKPIETKHTNLNLGKPTDWDETLHGTCESLPVHKDGDYFYSWWSTNWRQRIAILFGRPIRLCVVNGYHPPVHLDTVTA